jgi:hypothetical protein
MQIQVLAIGKRASVLGSAVNDQPAIAEDETHLPDYSDIGARDAANECSSGPGPARRRCRGCSTVPAGPTSTTP